MVTLMTVFAGLRNQWSIGLEIRSDCYYTAHPRPTWVEINIFYNSRQRPGNNSIGGGLGRPRWLR